MNYWHWILPFFLLTILIGYYLAKKVQQINSQASFKITWIIGSILFGVSLLLRSVLVIFIFYFIFFHLCYDILKWIISLFRNSKLNTWIEKIYFHGMLISLISLVFVIYGAINISNPIIKEYDIKIKTKEPTNFKIGMVSDLHLGITSPKETLKQLVESANHFNVDIFILAGDIFDEYTTEEEKEMAYQSFQQIKTKYGIYFIEGNHDLLKEKTKEAYEKNKIQVLDDKIITINNQYNLIGRKDARNNKEGNQRKNLTDLISLTNPNLPIILIDHQPKDEELAEQLGVDLQLSGHTHQGQIFPLNLFLKYGYKKKNDYQKIVSSGYGVWGVKARTAGRSEMIIINLTNE